MRKLSAFGSASPPRRRLIILLTLSLFLLPAAPSPTADTATLTDSDTAAAAGLFAYHELIQLYDRDPLPAPLQSRLDVLLNTPFVSNAAAERGVRPLKPRSEQLGRFLRVAQWNVERGLEFEALRAAFTDANRFAEIINREKYARGRPGRARLMEEMALLQEADVVILNEADWGLRRTAYRHVAAELAEALGMNYAYGVEFVEVDPLQLGSEMFVEAADEDRAELVSHLKVDQSRFRGLHGTAILSRYKLENVRLVPFKFQGHDWYAGEKRGVGALEAGKRAMGEKVFLEKLTREVRRGGRMMLVAEINDPEIPTGKAVIVATHLEARTAPQSRVKQLAELLAYVREINHPVVLAGDMNTSTSDSTPTSLQREIKKRLGSDKFWIAQGIKYAIGFGLLLDVAQSGIGFGRTHADPTVRSIKIVSENPEAKFFEALKDFRFADGGAFDFRGDRARTSNHRSGNLANSNERGSKGFATSFAVDRTIGPTGKLKLDWIFVKPASLTKLGDRTQPYRFAPHFGRTLSDLNHGTKERISDHNPVTVDLPFAEPHLR